MIPLLYYLLMASKTTMTRNKGRGVEQGCVRLLNLPPELLLAIFLKLEQPLDRIKLGETCRQLCSLAVSGDSLWRDLPVDLESMMATAFDMRSGCLRQHSLRSWVMRRRHAIRNLTVVWPGNEAMEGNLCLMPLIPSLVACLADSGLRSLAYTFHCKMPWLDALLPLGPAALQELSIDGCHWSVVPAGLASLAGSLTKLSIGLCEGFAKHAGPPLGLSKALGSLTGLQSLPLQYAAFGAVPSSLSSLTQLARLDLSYSELVRVPAVVTHFTGLRTLLLGGSMLGPPLDNDQPEEGEEEESQQGVPLALSALRRLQELGLERCSYLQEVPQAFVSLTSLTRLLIGGGLRTLAAGPYLANLHELSIIDTWTLHSPFLFEALDVAPRLCRLSLRQSRPVEGELPPAVLHLRQLTWLDVGFMPLSRFPAGPYTAHVEELHVDYCATRSYALMQTLPSFPGLCHLNRLGNWKLGVGPVRRLLAQAPNLKVLWLDPEDALTTPARKALAAAEAAVG